MAPPPLLFDAAALSSLTVETLVIVGEDDTLANAGDLQRLFAAVPAATVSVIAGADHFFVHRGLGEIRRTVERARAD